MEIHTFNSIKTQLSIESKTIENMVANTNRDPSITKATLMNYYNRVAYLEAILANHKEAISKLIERDAKMKVLIIAVTILLSACVNFEQQKFEQYSAKHNCKVISYTAPSSTTGAQFAMMGMHAVMIPAVQHIPARTEYLCDNGVRYTR